MPENLETRRDTQPGHEMVWLLVTLVVVRSFSQPDQRSTGSSVRTVSPLGLVTEFRRIADELSDAWL